MSEIRFRPPGFGRGLIPPVEPVTPGRGGQKFTEGEQHPPKELKVREGERKRTWVPSEGAAYDSQGKRLGSWCMLTETEAKELGLKWGE